MGADASDIGRSIQQTIDGGYIISGHTYSYGTGGQDIYLIKLCSEATLPGDLNCDGKVDFKDMAIFVNQWLLPRSISLPPADIAEPGDGTAHFFDFSVLANDWGDWRVLLDKATSPNPPDGAISVGITADLSWTASQGATSHDVYFGTNNPPPFILNKETTTYDPGTMAYNTKYYWRIDEVGNYGTIRGMDWSFTTIMSPPPP